MEIKMECLLSFSHSFNNKKCIFICINLFMFWHRPTQYFQLSNIESKLNLAKIASKFWGIRVKKKKKKKKKKGKKPQVTIYAEIYRLDVLIAGDVGVFI